MASSSLSSSVIVKWLAPPDELYPVVVRVADEAQPRAALAHLVRRALGLDALPGQSPERALEVVDADRDVPVGGAQLVRAAVVVVRQLEDAVRLADREEVVRCLELPLADDVHVALEAE